MRVVPLALVLLLAPATLGAQDGWKTDFSKHTVPPDEILSGGPPKDGIPAIDAPEFVTVDEADRWLEDREPVILLEESGDARAYPYQILVWHEIVNDVVGGRPLVITFCPLCNTALAFDRRHRSRTLDFGVTGMLRHSDLVMYDRQTETWWQQATGEAIVGRFAGDTLEFVPAQTLRWADFKRAHPDGRVLARETGHDRPYGRNPYAGYDQGGGPMGSFVSGDVDQRLPAMERVAAVRLGSSSVGYPFSALSEGKVVNDTVAGTPIVVFWAPGTASALDERTIARGRDVGSTGVFRSTVGDEALRFGAAGDGRFRDEATGTTWDLTGRAIDGPLRGSRLEPIPHGDYFWFAWSAFQPDTEIRR